MMVTLMECTDVCTYVYTGFKVITQHKSTWINEVKTMVQNGRAKIGT